MRIRDELQRKISRKQQEIAELEAKLRDARVYLQALTDMARVLPRDSGEMVGAESDAYLRPGTMVARARDILKKAGHPMHINELLTALGKPTDRNARAALGGSLSGYVRDRHIFIRPAPNTFALVEMEQTAPADSEPSDIFGMDVGGMIGTTDNGTTTGSTGTK